jgi:hypothetical protein
MNIDSIRETRLNDYLDGDMSAEDARHFESELERDPALRADLDALRRLSAEAVRLPRAIDPERDLWPAIARRLHPRTASPRPRTTGLRIALAAAMLVGAFLGGVWVATQHATDIGPSTALLNGKQQRPPIVAAFDQVRAEYAGMRNDVVAALATSKGSITPETASVIRENLEIIDKAVSQIDGALQKDPDNSALRDLLLAAYDNEVGLLRQVSDLQAGTKGEKHS